MLIQRCSSDGIVQPGGRRHRRRHPHGPARGDDLGGRAACGPGGLREASFGLGARRKATSIRIVVPAAISGIVAAMIVGLSRAIGETMVVAIVAGGNGGRSSPQPLRLRSDGDRRDGGARDRHRQVVGAGAAFPSLFFVGLLLFVLTFTLNVFSERFVRRYEAVLMAIGNAMSRERGSSDALRGEPRDIAGTIFAGAAPVA